MKKISYDEARADHEYLWSIDPASDMTGGYVDQDDLDRLLRSPTRATARDCYCDQIDYWFDHGPEDGGRERLKRLLSDDKRVREIALRHGRLNGDET